MAYFTARDSASIAAAAGPGHRIATLIDRASAGAQDGAVTLELLAPGATTGRHRYTRAQSALFVIEGDGTLVTADGDVPAPEGTVVFAPAGAWVALRAGADDVVAMSVLGAAGSRDEAGYELDASGDAGDGAPRTGHLADAEPQHFHDKALGCHHMAAQWLVSDEILGSRDLMLGQSTFARPDSLHELHRHPTAAELLYVREGHGAHLTEDGEVPMGPGDIAYIPAGEWHGFRNAGDATVRTVFGYLGVGNRDAGGYEVKQEI